jgi:hypothetical protein
MWRDATALVVDCDTGQILDPVGRRPAAAAVITA